MLPVYPISQTDVIGTDLTLSIKPQNK